MKRLIILLAVMSVCVFFLLSDKDQEEIKEEGKRIKKKLKKSHFPKKEPISV